MENIYTLGIDIGSTASKCVILENGSRLAASSVVSIGAGTTGPERSVGEALSAIGIDRMDLKYVIATGYGRNTYERCDDQISELSCHAKGAGFLFPGVRTIIDIGGQDAKVLHIAPNGKMTNFLMNDKCAAGTGRFLDVMAKVLDVELSSFPDLDEKSTKKVDISSTCTVFAETEVISHLAKAEMVEDIISGIHRSVANRVGNLAKRLGVEETVVMTGGVAKNSGIVKALEKELNTPIMTNELCQLNGALGAALYAHERWLNESEEETDESS